MAVATRFSFGRTRGAVYSGWTRSATRFVTIGGGPDPGLTLTDRQLGRGESGSSRYGGAFRYEGDSPARHGVAFSLFFDHLGRRVQLASLLGTGVSLPVPGGRERIRPAAARSENDFQPSPT